MTTRSEALTKKLLYETVDSRNEGQITDALAMELEGFRAGIDPVESPEAIAYIAQEGWVWLQYAIENGQKNPTGVIELVPLERALKFNPNNNSSALAIIVKNQGDVFQGARRFAGDRDAIYHHGISMSRRSRGYGKLLLRHALENTPDVRRRTISCYIDLATIRDDSLAMAPNEVSYALHINKGGFVVVGVVDPPVYDNNTTQFAALRPSDEKPFRLSYVGEKRLKLNDSDAYRTICDLKELTSKGYVGVRYDIMTHEMTFAKLR